MRGYLWENLSAEIAAEFEGLGRVDRAELTRVGNYYVGSLATWQSIARTEWLEEDKALPPDVLAALRAQRRVAYLARNAENPLRIPHAERRRREREALTIEGKCRDCKGPKQHDNQRCDACRVKHAENNKKLRAKKKQEAEHMREKLPTERVGVTQKFTIIARKFDETGAPLDGVRELKGYITASIYPDRREDGTPHPMAGKLGEVFVKVGKPGEPTALLDEWAQSVSRELQRGADPVALFGKHRFTQFEPSGAVRGIKGVTRCSSPTDLVAQYIGLRFLGVADDKSTEVK